MDWTGSTTLVHGSHKPTAVQSEMDAWDHNAKGYTFSAARYAMDDQDFMKSRADPIFDSPILIKLKCCLPSNLKRPSGFRWLVAVFFSWMARRGTETVATMADL
jgi:hypothetical protein